MESEAAHSEAEVAEPEVAEPEGEVAKPVAPAVPEAAPAEEDLRARTPFDGPPGPVGGHRQCARCYPPRAPPSASKGSSSIGRAPVSKTGGWGFDSLLPCSPGPEGSGQIEPRRL